jgi:hypothetical protein
MSFKLYVPIPALACFGFLFGNDPEPATLVDFSVARTVSTSMVASC